MASRDVSAEKASRRCRAAVATRLARSAVVSLFSMACGGGVGAHDSPSEHAVGATHAPKAGEGKLQESVQSLERHVQRERGGCAERSAAETRDGA